MIYAIVAQILDSCCSVNLCDNCACSFPNFGVFIEELIAFLHGTVGSYPFLQLHCHIFGNQLDI